MPDQELTILSGIDLTVMAAESLAIVGESGSGKSTLLGLLAGLDVPSSGAISLMGQALNSMTEDQRAAVRAAHVGFVFQSFQLLPNLTALENVMLPLEIADEKAVPERARNMLAKVGLEKRLNHYPSQLSGGEQQRVALARAFVTEPDILFADEPTGNLDTHTGEAIADQLFELNASLDTTLILVTHDMHLARRCARTVTMNAGQLQ
ncbi:MAG: ABC transporter [Pseudomonadales bacterium]|nr:MULTISPECIES: ABC transporter ATP-binding protein [unclassified Ketobacter]MAQ24894.1 ABC transporter [Pseudomonadales bacterium]MEC8810644.1 ABC transporter ATP-binding protein [Pseudomonadota bacterium]HAU15176.1 ABC transporter [Gammaproteobacteria bacterium]MBI26743.1 ABC transporter [Pseudomonadales bacterium]RLT89161.1 MAG: ABC transporter ATP-binding protein [Ketobacter sp. GenoA1]